MRVTRILEVLLVALMFSAAATAQDKEKLVFEYPRGDQQGPLNVTAESLADLQNMQGSDDDKKWFLGHAVSIVQRLQVRGFGQVFGLKIYRPAEASAEPQIEVQTMASIVRDANPEQLEKTETDLVSAPSPASKGSKLGFIGKLASFGVYFIPGAGPPLHYGLEVVGGIVSTRRARSESAASPAVQQTVPNSESSWFSSAVVSGPKLGYK